MQAWLLGSTVDRLFCHVDKQGSRMSELGGYFLIRFRILWSAGYRHRSRQRIMRLSCFFLHDLLIQVILSLAALENQQLTGRLLPRPRSQHRCEPNAAGLLAALWMCLGEKQRT